MNIVRAFISVDGLEVYHVAHDLVLFRNSIRSVHVPREARDKIFMPYFSTKGRGSGLGLAICKELVEARNQADALVHSTEKALADHGDKVGADEKTAIEAALADLKSALEGEDAEAIKAKASTLAQASMKLGEAMYNATNQGGETEGSSEAPAEEGVVDAEFEEVDGDGKKSA